MKKNETTAEWVERILKLHARGVITTPELMQNVLLNSIEEDNRVNQRQLFEQLPELMLQRLLEFLQELEAISYRWKPFLLGVPITEVDDKRKERIRRFHEDVAEFVRTRSPRSDTKT